MSDIHDEGHIHSGCEEPPNSESRLRGEPLDLASEIALRCGFDDGDAIDAVRIVVSEGWRSPMDFDALLAENKALQAKLNEYDKYVAEFTNRA